MVKEAGYQFEKFTKYSLNNTINQGFVKILLSLNIKTQIIKHNHYLNLFKPITTP